MPMNPGDLEGKIKQLILLFKAAPTKAETAAGWDRQAKQMVVRYLDALHKTIAKETAPPANILPALKQQGAGGPLLAFIGDIHERVAARVKKPRR